MEYTKGEEKEMQSLWINQNEQILSFHQEESKDYKELVFPDQKEKMEFVFQKCSKGFRIQ